MNQKIVEKILNIRFRFFVSYVVYKTCSYKDWITKSFLCTEEDDSFGRKKKIQIRRLDTLLGYSGFSEPVRRQFNF